MGTVTRKEARVRTKRLWLLLASIVLMLGGFAPVIVFSVGAVLSGHYLLLPLAFVPYFVAEFWLMHLWNRKWLERRGELRADERGLWLDEVIVVPRSSLRHGHIVQRDGVTCVRLGRMLQPVEVVVEHEDEGKAILAAMRLDAPRSVGHYTMTHGTRRSSWVRAAVFLALWAPSTFGLMHVTENVFLFFASLFAWAIAGTIWSGHQFVRVSVGADGIHLRRLLSRPRFIPFAALQTAEIDGQNVYIRLRDGGVETMHHLSSGKGWKPLLYRDRADEGQMLVDRINTQAEQHRRDGAKVGLLARGARSTREWLREVALASDEHASFRTAAVPLDELWRVVEDPVAATTARAGAALALRSRLDDAGRSRLRVAADACAAPKLRVALQHVASDAKPESLEDVYEDLEDEDACARARA
ncbi:MAG: hypothetical protein KF819_02320 [Labilithrix sp.]|nr:hypothetical protein [Labilithrix sp.]